MRKLRNRDIVIAAAGGLAVGLAAHAVLRGRDGRLRGQVVLITGGSRGLGLSLARAFAREGCQIAICARDGAELLAAREDLQRLGASALALECDVSDRQQVAHMLDEAVRHYGRIDILVNNAGVIQVGPVESMSIDDFDQAMRIMFWGTVYPTMALLPHMAERGSGRIVNITSIGGKLAVPHLLPYTCAKFAAVGFSEGLRAEMAGKGVKVVTIAPGLMRTGSYLNAFFKGDHPRETVWFSIGATMPGVSMSAERATRQIVNATKKGEAEKILTAPASLAARFHGLFPGVTADILGLVNRLVLPAGRSQEQRSGRETGVLERPLLSALTILGRQAARRFLEQPEQRALSTRL
jgi:NAD(P)-dependent dehydrogenase (short-subunit alcohol dehydrogenase family)